MIFKKIQKNKFLKFKRRGFVLLFTSVLVSILFSIALGITNLALREVNFSTSGRDANDAFFAADTGAECALFYDRGLSVFQDFPNDNPMTCAGSNITLNGSSPTWNFTVSDLGSTTKACAFVTITKDSISAQPSTTISSIGKNNCNATNRVERELDVVY